MERCKILKNSEVFNQLEEPECRAIGELAEERTYKSGTVIGKEGQKAEEFYLKAIEYGDKGASFTIQIDPDSTAIYRIGYRHELKGDRAEYILTTAQTWGRPFEQVNYSLTFPKELSLDSLSYTPDSLREENNRYIFFWYKENFMPSRNFIIHFSQKNK